MDFTSRLRSQAAALGKTIVLPEIEDERTLQAAAAIRDAGIAKVILLGDADTALRGLKALDLSPDGLAFVDPATDADRETLADRYFQKRKHKGVTPESAREAVRDGLLYGALLVDAGRADGMVAGAVNATGDVLRAAFQAVGTAPGCSTVSSCFVMVREGWTLGTEGMVVFGDCAVNPQPTAAQLADIATASAATARALCGFEPRVAMLSYSTRGSGAGADVDKVEEAVRLVREKAPALAVDGPLQADAALVASVGERKAPGSAVAGHANVLIFPDLDAGNIGYKLVQRLAGAEAVGPVLQGMAKPVNDLSRGCSVDDIVNVAAITALQAAGSGS
ncbi:MAG TPA: phosphate acetyltransferase [Candidatus Krumholzibacteria bacterium]|nr:phosphate acetyltransferase [Candidatus Krumholzibacteria bacterium]